MSTFTFGLQSLALLLDNNDPDTFNGAWVFGGGRPYNITTGTDANGDGDFNDRPSLVPASGPGVYSTRFGLLTTNRMNGNVPRKLGTMPDVVHLDTNLSRAFTLKSGNKDHPARIRSPVNHRFHSP